MPDITMCKGEDCTQSYKCYRYTAEPSMMQSYFLESPNKKVNECEYFWENVREKQLGEKKS